jgi:hypothetical protein
LANATQTPVLILAAGREEWNANECRLWGELRGPRFAVNLRGAEHLTPTDAVWLAKGGVETGDMGREKTIAAMRDYIAAFLDANLRGKPLPPLADRTVFGVPRRRCNDAGAITVPPLVDPSLAHASRESRAGY